MTNRSPMLSGNHTPSLLSHPKSQGLPSASKFLPASWNTLTRTLFPCVSTLHFHLFHLCILPEIIHWGFSPPLLPHLLLSTQWVVSQNHTALTSLDKISIHLHYFFHTAFVHLNTFSPIHTFSSPSRIKNEKNIRSYIFCYCIMGLWGFVLL